LNWSKSIIHSNGVTPKPTEDDADVVVNEVVDSNPNHKERQKQLRTYICAVQVQFHIMRHYYTILQKNGNVEGLVSWEELVQVWQSFQASDNADQVRHEQVTNNSRTKMSEHIKINRNFSLSFPCFLQLIS
jgi:hypothetical protein